MRGGWGERGAGRRQHWGRVKSGFLFPILLELVGVFFLRLELVHGHHTDRADLWSVWCGLTYVVADLREILWRDSPHPTLNFTAAALRVPRIPNQITFM